MGWFDFILDPIFMPLMELKPFYAIAIVSLGITLLITLIYKFTTDQNEMKRLKADMKKHQAEIKKNKDDPEKMMSLNKKAMESNMKYMKHSMKSTLYTMIPIIIIFGYLNLHMGYFPIMPGEQFSTTVEFRDGVNGEIELLNNNLEYLNGQVQQIENGLATWQLKGDAGEYILQYEFSGRTYDQELLITEERTYKRIDERVKNSDIKVLRINNEKIIAMNILGWEVGWLGTYIILSILFSMIVRKVLKVH